MAKQGSLEGIGPKSIPEVEDAAEELRVCRRNRQILATQEEELQVKLRDILKKHGIRKKYIYEVDDDDGSTIKFDAFIEKAEERAYVRKHKDPKAEKNGDSEEKESTGE